MRVIGAPPALRATSPSGSHCSIGPHASWDQRNAGAGAGSIIVSLVLGLPTVGPLLLRSLISQDMFLAGTIVLLLGIMTVIGTLVSDVLLVWIDPRIRLEET